MKRKIKEFIVDVTPALIIIFVWLICMLFVLNGKLQEDGSYTLGGSFEKAEFTESFIENANEALNRLMNQDIATDDDTIDASKDGVGLGAYTDINTIISRIRTDGDNDNGNGWQCSKYTAYLATGIKDYSRSNPDYGPVHGKNVAEWLVRNYGFKYISEPVKGAIGSGGFNTTYGHTAVYLYSTGTNTAMVNDANYTPLKVSTHNMNISGWVWVVPSNYEQETPKPTPTPVANNVVKYTYQQGDYFSGVLVKLGLDENNLWGVNGTVKYYTTQLVDQNMLDSRGNVKIGIPFELRRR